MLERISVASGKQRDCSGFDRRRRAGDGYIEEINRSFSGFRMQAERELGRDRAHLENDGARLCRRKDTALSQIDGADSIVICQRRENHIRGSHEVRK